MAQAPPGTLVAHLDRVLLSIPADPAYRSALRLLLGGLGNEAQLSYEQVNELQLAVEALLAHRTVAGDKLIIERVRALESERDRKPESVGDPSPELVAAAQAQWKREGKM